MSRGIPSDVLVRRERCEGCAFKPGSKANAAPLTTLKARLCALSGEPFYCHENVSGEVVDGKPVYTTHGPSILCAGWHELVQRYLADGTYAQQEPWRRRVYDMIADLIQDAESDLLDEDFWAVFRERLQEIGVAAGRCADQLDRPRRKVVR